MSRSAFIFDFDGVIADSLSAHIAAWELAFQDLFGVSLDKATGLRGMSTDDIAALLAAKGSKPDAKQDLISLKISHLKRKALTISLLPGASETLGFLRNHGKTFGICSNASADYIRKVLAHNKVECEVIVGHRDAARPKPAPDGYILCAERLSLSPATYSDIVVFEDSFHGLEAAVRAGMYAVGIASQHTPSELLREGAAEVFPDLATALAANFFS